MDSIKSITGTVVFKKNEGGFWGIEADDNYLPIDFPEQLKYDGATVSCIIQQDLDLMSFINWGEPCHIISFSTIYTQ